MTTPGVVPQLDYATPMPGRKSHGVLRILLALTLALLAADSFALAAGFDPVGNIGREPMPLIGRLLTGAVIFALVLAAAGPLGGWIRGARSGLATGGTRGRAETLALIICGTVCILAALAVEVYLVRYGQTVVTHAVRDSNAGPHLLVAMRPPVFGRILAVAAFFVGVMLVASGASGGAASDARQPS